MPTSTRLVAHFPDNNAHILLQVCFITMLFASFHPPQWHIFWSVCAMGWGEIWLCICAMWYSTYTYQHHHTRARTPHMPSPCPWYFSHFLNDLHMWQVVVFMLSTLSSWSICDELTSSYTPNHEREKKKETPHHMPLFPVQTLPQPIHPHIIPRAGSSSRVMKSWPCVWCGLYIFIQLKFLI